MTQPRDVVLYGFGRIGRLMARLLIEKAGGGDVLRLRAVVVRRSSSDDLAKRAALLRRDSIHGSFKGTIRVDDERNSFIANGNEVKLIHADAPENIDYTAHGINDAIVIDNTGKWRDEQGLSRHLQSKGVAKVILTAPGKGALKRPCSDSHSSWFLATPETSTLRFIWCVMRPSVTIVSSRTAAPISVGYSTTSTDGDIRGRDRRLEPHRHEHDRHDAGMQQQRAAEREQGVVAALGHVSAPWPFRRPAGSSARRAAHPPAATPP